MTSTRNISLFFFTLNVDVMSFYQLVWKIITYQVINIIFDHFCQFEMIVFSRAVQLLTPERRLNALFHQVLWQLWNTSHVFPCEMLILIPKCVVCLLTWFSNTWGRSIERWRCSRTQLFVWRETLSFILFGPTRRRQTFFGSQGRVLCHRRDKSY